MTKQTQNKVAESKLTLPVTIIYAGTIWLIAGLIVNHWWMQFGAFFITSLLMMELNNRNALLRIYSRMVSCSFIALSCCACFLFPMTEGVWMQLCVIASYIVLFQSYQDTQATGMIYYAFVLLGLASVDFVYLLYAIPVVWLLMSIHLQNLSWKTWGASVLGLLTPYWFGACWLFYTQEISLLANHFSVLSEGQFPIDYQVIPSSSQYLFLWLVVLFIIGTTHFVNKSYSDKIRIRMYYQFFIWMNILIIISLLVQPQHYQYFLRLMLINTAPLIAHFIALTSTKWTNITFWTIVTVTFLLTAFNLWKL